MSKHNFLSIDLETTGLDVTRDQILQVGAVAYGGEGKIAELDVLVKHERYEGQAYALQMNAGLLRRLAGGEGVILWKALDLLHEFVLDNCAERPFPVGFNVGKFDRVLLERDWNLSKSIVYDFPLHRRVLELGTLYARPAHGFRPASSAEVCQNVLDLDEMPHDALQDARINAALHAKKLIDDGRDGWPERVWRHCLPPEMR